MATIDATAIELNDHFVVGTVSSPPAATAVQAQNIFVSEPDDATIFATAQSEQSQARFRKKLSAFCHGGIGLEFFEKIFVLPRAIDAGVIISDQGYTIDIYSSYRKVTRDWTAYDDSALGVGADISTPIPPPTIVLQPQAGVTRTFTLDSEGAPTINASIIFTFDTGTVLLPVTGERSQLFPYEPENDFFEDIAFLTDVLEAKSGKEQRRALRADPRSILQFNVLADDEDRQKLENQLFDAQGRALGVPRWHEAVLSTAAVTATDTSVTVETTSFADFRVGQSAVVWVDAFDFEVVQIATVGATSISVTSPFTQAFPVGSRVMPVNLTLFSGTLSSARYRTGLLNIAISAQVLNNDSQLADTSAFSTYNSKVLLDDTNFLLGETLSEAFTMSQTRIDNRTGAPVLITDQDVARRTSSKSFVTVDRQSSWEVRQVLHALRGRQISFYLPSFNNDFTPVDDISSGGSTIDVTDVKYSTVVNERQSRNVIRVVKTDGTKSAPKLITSATSPSPGVDRLSIAGDTWGIDALVADIERVEYVHKVRFDSDRVRMRFKDASGNMSVGIQTKEVLE